MKNYLVFALMSILLLSGCSTKIPFVNNTYYIDYTTFTKNGFFVTESDAAPFDYDAVGHMEVELRSGNEVLSEKVDEFTGGMNIKYGKYVKAKLEDAMKEFQKQATAKGANGAIKLDIKPIVENVKVNSFGIQTVNGYRISGMLIKIR